MKVQFEKGYKNYLTVAEVQEAKKIIQDMKEDTSLEDYAQQAARVASGQICGKFKIFDCKAEICRNSRIDDNFYTENSGILDIWISFVAFDSLYGCYECGIALSDVWQIGGMDDNAIKQHMYINAFTKK